MLEVKELSCSYGMERVLKGVTFALQDNERICILGPNGCGKTTLLKAVARFLPFCGSIQIDGKNIQEFSRKIFSTKIALMTQLSSTYFSYTVYDTVMLGRYAYQQGLVYRERQEDRQVVEQCMEKTGVLKIKDKLITELSGGQLQRVFLARTFAQDPEIILLDEPTNHLDLKHQLELVEYLKQWSVNGLKKRSVLGVFHDVNLAMKFADKLMLMDSGRVVAFESVDKFDLNSINNIYKTDISGYMLESLKKWERVTNI